MHRPRRYARHVKRGLVGLLCACLLATTTSCSILFVKAPPKHDPIDPGEERIPRPLAVVVETADRLDVPLPQHHGNEDLLVVHGEVVDAGAGDRLRVPFEVDLTGVVKEGENVVAVRVDNRKISELFLGGILRPVALVEKQ